MNVEYLHPDEFGQVAEDDTLGNLPSAEFHFSDDKPSEIIIDGSAIPIESTERMLDSSEFLTYKPVFDERGRCVDVKFENPDAQAFFSTVTRLYYSRVATYLDESIREEFMLNTQKDVGGGARGQSRSLDRGYPRKLSMTDEDRLEIRSDVLTDVARWADSLNERNTTVRERELLAGGDFGWKVRIVQIGNAQGEPRRAWNAGLEAVRVLYFAKTRLGLGGARDITIYEDDAVDVEMPLGGFRSRSRSLADSTGCTFGANDVVIMGGANLLVDRTGEDDQEMTGVKVIDLWEQTASMRHEVTHLLIYYSLGSIPLNEGLATAMEVGFSFGSAYRELRERCEYESKVTRGKMLELYSRNVPEGFAGIERYNLSATFICYLYEKLGPEGLMEVCDYLSGVKASKGSVINSGNPFIDKMFSYLPDYSLRGDLRRTLAVVAGRGSENPLKAADSLLDGYVEEINKSAGRYFVE